MFIELTLDSRTKTKTKVTINTDHIVCFSHIGDHTELSLSIDNNYIVRAKENYSTVKEMISERIQDKTDK